MYSWRQPRKKLYFYLFFSFIFINFPYLPKYEIFGGRAKLIYQDELLEVEKESKRINQ